MTSLCIPAESDPRPLLPLANGYEGVRIDAQIWSAPSKWDPQRKAIRAAGLGIVHVLAYFDGLDPHKPTSPDRYAKACAAWAERHYEAGDILEVYNEPNLAKFWTDPDPALYSKYLRAAAQSIRAKMPSAKIVTGGLAHVADCGEYLRGMVAGGCFAAGMADGCGLHPYPEGGSVEAGLLRGALVARPILPPGIELHATELGMEDHTASFDAPGLGPNLLTGPVQSYHADVTPSKMLSAASSKVKSAGQYPGLYVKGDPGPGLFRCSVWARSDVPAIVTMGLDEDHAASFAVGPTPRLLSAVFEADPARPVADRRLFVAKPASDAVVEFGDSPMLQAVSLSPEEVYRLRLRSKLQQAKDAPMIAKRLGYSSCAWFAAKDHDGSYGLFDERGRSKALML